jgi:hypothetical protein
MRSGGYELETRNGTTKVLSLGKIGISSWVIARSVMGPDVI